MKLRDKTPPPIKISFIQTQETELKSLLSYTDRVQNRFYLTSQYYVLPYVVPGHKRAIHFPELKIYESKDFWKLCPYYDFEYMKRFPQKYQRLLKQFSSSYIPFKFNKIEKEFRSVFPTFYKSLSDISPNIFQDIKEVIIMPTRFGSVCSEYSSQNKNKNIIKLFAREDATIVEIFYMILMERLNKTRHYTEYSWNERMAICEYMMLNTKLNKLFPKFQPTIPDLQNPIELKMWKESITYQAKLGINVGEAIIKNKNDIYINGKIAIFTPIEKRVLINLVDNKKKIVPFDQIANAMWGEDANEKYSLYAISKCIERIRLKMIDHNIAPQIIQTYRSQGYRLVD